MFKNISYYYNVLDYRIIDIDNIYYKKIKE